MILALEAIVLGDDTPVSVAPRVTLEQLPRACGDEESAERGVARELGADAGFHDVALVRLPKCDAVGQRLLTPKAFRGLGVQAGCAEFRALFGRRFRGLKRVLHRRVALALKVARRGVHVGEEAAEAAK
eukprot:3732010-Prymnesium_polylepis.1